MDRTARRARAVKLIGALVAVLAASGAACQSPHRPDPGDRSSAAATATPGAADSQPSSVSFEVMSVTLNYGARNMEIVGRLRSTGAVKPKKVWVWAYFFSPEPKYADGSWSGAPVEINDPFATGELAVINAVGPFAWRDDPQAPQSGYYARVSISTQSAEAATVPAARRNKATAGAHAVRVVR